MKRHRNNQKPNPARTYWSALSSDAAKSNPDLEAVGRVAMLSGDKDLMQGTYEFINAQQAPAQVEPDQEPTLWQRPTQYQCRGDIFIGYSVPDGLPVFLSLRSFGANGHKGCYGGTGSGKSYLLDLISYQLTMKGIPVKIHDTLNQSAPKLVRLLSEERLAVFDYSNYQRNLFRDPECKNQRKYLLDADEQIGESLALSPVGMSYLMQICDEIMKNGRVVTIPGLIEHIKNAKGQAKTREAILNRLYPLSRAGEKTFSYERGFDTQKLSQMSVIYELKFGTNVFKRRVLFNDEYFGLIRNRKQLIKWRLNEVFIFHEAADLLHRKNISDYFKQTIKECRNYGIGLCFADQSPHLENDIAVANIGTRCIFRVDLDKDAYCFKTQLRLSEEQCQDILNLPDRIMIVRKPGVPFPFKVRVPNLL